jgi:hypothetical protein
MMDAEPLDPRLRPYVAAIKEAVDRSDLRTLRRALKELEDAIQDEAIKALNVAADTNIVRGALGSLEDGFCLGIWLAPDDQVVVHPIPRHITDEDIRGFMTRSRQDMKQEL